MMPCNKPQPWPAESSFAITPIADGKVYPKVPLQVIIDACLKTGAPVDLTANSLRPYEVNFADEEGRVGISFRHTAIDVNHGVYTVNYHDESGVVHPIFTVAAIDVRGVHAQIEAGYTAPRDLWWRLSTTDHLTGLKCGPWVSKGQEIE